MGASSNSCAYDLRASREFTFGGKIAETQVWRNTYMGGDRGVGAGLSD